jgi:hypothetical protein
VRFSIASLVTSRAASLSRNLNCKSSTSSTSSISACTTGGIHLWNSEETDDVKEAEDEEVRLKSALEHSSRKP